MRRALVMDKSARSSRAFHGSVPMGRRSSFISLRKGPGSISSGRLLKGKKAGMKFIPQQLSRAQIKAQSRPQPVPLVPVLVQPDVPGKRVRQ